MQENDSSENVDFVELLEWENLGKAAIWISDGLFT